MENFEETIIHKATAFFSAYGPQSVSMDYIAWHCGISKKTLYKFFDSKELLVTSVVKNLLHPNKQYLSLQSGAALDAVAQIRLLFDEVQNKLQLLTPIFFRGIKKQFPQTFHLIELYGKRTLVPVLKGIIKQGITEGNFNAEVDEATATDLYCRLLQNILEGSSGLLNKKNNPINTTHHFFLNGLLTVNGLQADLLKINNLNK